MTHLLALLIRSKYSLKERCELAPVYGFTCSNCRTMTTGGDEASDVIAADTADFTTSTVGATLTATVTGILVSTGLSDLAVKLPDCGVLSAADSLPSEADGLLSKAGSTTTSGLHPIVVQAITIEPAVTVGGVTAVGTTVRGATDIDTTAGEVAVVVTAVGGVTENGTTVGNVPVADTSCACVANHRPWSRLPSCMAWHRRQI